MEVTTIDHSSGKDDVIHGIPCPPIEQKCKLLFCSFQKEHGFFFFPFFMN